MSTVLELKPKKPAAREKLRSAEEIRTALAGVEQRLAFSQRERNAAQTELHSLLISREPELDSVRELREQIASHTAEIDFLAEQRRALEAECIVAAQRERQAARERSKDMANDLARKIRADVARLPGALKEVIAIYEALSRNQTLFAEALRPAGGQLLYPLTVSLPQLLLMQLYALADGLIPAPRGVFQTPFELRAAGSVADVKAAAETMISASLKCFAGPAPQIPQPPDAA